MTLEIAFELNDTDLERFQALFRTARTKAGKIEPQALMQAARALVQIGLANEAPDFVRPRLEGLGQLVEMVEYTTWDLPAEERGRIMDALAYFVAADDVIPDTTPVLGLLDDAIAAELVLRATRHELDAYQEFSRYRTAEAQRRANAGKPTDVSKEDWLADSSWWLAMNVTVSGGTVHLWGALQSEAEKHAAPLVAESTEGVREIEDHLGVIPPQVRSVLWAE